MSLGFASSVENDGLQIDHARLKILDAEGLEQVGGDARNDNSLFAVRLRLKGHHRLADLQRRVHEEFVPLAIKDFKLGNCDAIFIDPDSSEFDADFEYQCVTRSVLRAFGFQKKDFDYFANRVGKTYQAAAFHAHINARATVSMGTEAGRLPTAWVSDEIELLGLIEEGVHSVGGKIVDIFNHDMDAVLSEVDVRNRAVAACHSLKKLHSDGGEPRSDVIKVYDYVFSKIQGLIERMPEVGRINIFGRLALHAANPYSHEIGDDAAGDLIVESWK